MLELSRAGAGTGHRMPPPEPLLLHAITRLLDEQLRAGRRTVLGSPAAPRKAFVVALTRGGSGHPIPDSAESESPYRERRVSSWTSSRRVGWHSQGDCFTAEAATSAPTGRVPQRPQASCAAICREIAGIDPSTLCAERGPLPVAYKRRRMRWIREARGEGESTRPDAPPSQVDRRAEPRQALAASRGRFNPSYAPASGACFAR
jgi:hypothetical protein